MGTCWITQFDCKLNLDLIWKIILTFNESFPLPRYLSQQTSNPPWSPLPSSVANSPIYSWTPPLLQSLLLNSVQKKNCFFIKFISLLKHTTSSASSSFFILVVAAQVLRRTRQTERIKAHGRVIELLNNCDLDNRLICPLYSFNGIKLSSRVKSGLLLSPYLKHGVSMARLLSIGST